MICARMQSVYGSRFFGLAQFIQFEFLSSGCFADFSTSFAIISMNWMFRTRNLGIDSNLYSACEVNQSICFNFKKMTIVPAHYSIQANKQNLNGKHLKSSVLEGSNERNSWIEIDLLIRSWGTPDVWSMNLNGECLTDTSFLVSECSSEEAKNRGDLLRISVSLAMKTFCICSRNGLKRIRRTTVAKGLIVADMIAPLHRANCDWSVNLLAGLAVKFHLST
jgi:hypothetical protein